MRCVVRPIRERGRLPPPGQLRAREAVSGALLLAEEYCPIVRRTQVVARLRPFGEPMGTDLLPPLRDVRLVSVGVHGLSLAGNERYGRDHDLVEYAQSWLVLPEADR
jgi:hypothetical protein